jgi:DNA-binding GntR family transcriptional regulator
MLLSCREHFAILEILLTDRRTWASDLLRQHLQNALDHVF